MKQDVKLGSQNSCFKNISETKCLIDKKKKIGHRLISDKQPNF